MTKRRCCVFTFARNENVFLPIWLRYYSRFFEGQDIYVLDHGSDDGTVEACRQEHEFNVVPIPFENYNQIFRNEVSIKKQAELLKAYEYVLYTDADEMIMPNPAKYRDLSHYIAKAKKDCIRCRGYDILNTKGEPPIDLGRPLLEQRRYWYRGYFYDKPLLARVPLKWTPGFHSVEDTGYRQDKDLWLIHLHKMDFALCWEKHAKIASLKWDEECIKRGCGRQFRIQGREEFENYFYGNANYSRPELMKHCLKHYLRCVKYFLERKTVPKNDIPLWILGNLRFPPRLTRIPKSLKKALVL